MRSSGCFRPHDAQGNFHFIVEPKTFCLPTSAAESALFVRDCLVRRGGDLRFHEYDGDIRRASSDRKPDWRVIRDASVDVEEISVSPVVEGDGVERKRD
jgi:hypothetical protein